ncbi:MAG: hypothetical protein Hyperionvirus16_43 [Hyperionvirus sp.]|uniref:Uncharacterized protein n=1 Tax=Hyperionvirus sp. TaxID=2487770 RepID=A0A3G5A9Z1_9VIRU|nr:MAG: hypothetical protein Hyperionvirus16_43 [Hyperionvirus sp.]
MDNLPTAVLGYIGAFTDGVELDVNRRWRQGSLERMGPSSTLGRIHKEPIKFVVSCECVNAGQAIQAIYARGRQDIFLAMLRIIQGRPDCAEIWMSVLSFDLKIFQYIPMEVVEKVVEHHAHEKRWDIVDIGTNLKYKGDWYRLREIMNDILSNPLLHIPKDLTIETAARHVDEVLYCAKIHKRMFGENPYHFRFHVRFMIGTRIENIPPKIFEAVLDRYAKLGMIPKYSSTAPTHATYFDHYRNINVPWRTAQLTVFERYGLEVEYTRTWRELA